MSVSRSKAVVVGAGVMGHGICQILAHHNLKVVLVDPDDRALTRAMRWINDNLNYMVYLERLEENYVSKIINNISLTSNLRDSLADACYIIEAATEDFKIKRNIWEDLSIHAPFDAVLASNTSSYNINELARDISYPERIVGTHWFHPPTITPCVEVIPCSKTSRNCLEWTMDFLRSLGKTPTICKSEPGFVANRIQMAMAKEALKLVEEGLATPVEVDQIVKSSIGFRLGVFGPFEIIDQAGVDVYKSIYEYLYSKIPKDCFKPPKIISDMVSQNRLGLKTGKGFYDYESNAADNTRRKRDRRLYRRLDLYQEEFEND